MRMHKGIKGKYNRQASFLTELYMFHVAIEENKLITYNRNKLMSIIFYGVYYISKLPKKSLRFIKASDQFLLQNCNDKYQIGVLIMIQSRREIRKRIARFLKENFVEAFVDEEINENKIESNGFTRHGSSLTNSIARCNKYAPCAPYAAPQIKNMDDFLKSNFDEDGLAKRLNLYMYERDITTAMIYERCYVDRRLISKITSGTNYHPSKNTMLALCIGLHLNLQEGEEFLLLAGYSFSNTSKYDLIIKFMLQNKIYDLDTINDMLDQYEQPCFGA